MGVSGAGALASRCGIVTQTLALVVLSVGAAICGLIAGRMPVRAWVALGLAAVPVTGIAVSRAFC